jgi:hypothetical protein
MWSAFFQQSDVPDRFDGIFGLTGTQVLEEYIRIQLYFVSGAALADLELGQVFLGTTIDIGDPEPFHTRLRLPAAWNETEAGGLSVIGRGNRSESWPLSFRGQTDTQLSNIKTIESAQYGSVRPIMVHTHRHTGNLEKAAWGTMNYNASYLAGAHFFHMQGQELAYDEIESDVNDIDFPLYRSMGASET